MVMVEIRNLAQTFENDDIMGTAMTDFANDGEVSRISTPTKSNSIMTGPRIGLAKEEKVGLLRQSRGRSF